MRDRALALDEQQLSPALASLDDEPLRRAGDEVRDDRVDGDPPAGDRDPGLPRRDEAGPRCPRARASRSSSSETVIFPIAQSEPTVSTILPGHLEVRAASARRGPAGARRRSVSVTPKRVGELDELRVVGEELVQPVLDRDPLPDAVAQELAPGGREPAALGRDADERGRRAEAAAPRRRRRRSARPRSSSPARVESRIATTSSRR